MEGTRGLLHTTSEALNRKCAESVLMLPDLEGKRREAEMG